MNKLFFGKSNRAVEFIAKTGIMIAVTVVAQFLAGAISGGQQPVVGSVVNMCLILAVMMNGILGGVVVGAITPFMGYMLGLGGNVTLLPFIAIANMILVAGFILSASALRVDFSLKITSGLNSLKGFASVIIAAVLKFLFLYFVVLKLILPLIMAQVPAPLNIMLGTLQLMTATIGGVLAYLLAYPLSRAKVL